MTCPIIIVRLMFKDEESMPQPQSVEGNPNRELELISKAIMKLKPKSKLKSSARFEILVAQAPEDSKDFTLFIGM